LENTTVTSVPQITRMIARIADWRDGHGKMLAELRRDLLARR
jgi:hypothetical protein